MRNTDAFHEKEKDTSDEYDAPVQQTNRVLQSIQTLPLFFIYIAATQVYQPIAVFKNLSADIIKRKGQTAEASEYLSSVNQIVPIVSTPLLGLFMDHFGYRMEIVPLTALLYMTTFGLLAYSDANPLIAMIISSFGQAFNTAPYLVMIPLLIIDNRTVGFAWGLWKALASTSQVIMDISLGKVQNNSPDNSYTEVLKILLAVKATEFFWGITYILIDKLYAMGPFARVKRQDEQTKHDAEVVKHS